MCPFLCSIHTQFTVLQIQVYFDTISKSLSTMATFHSLAVLALSLLLPMCTGHSVSTMRTLLATCGGGNKQCCPGDVCNGSLECQDNTCQAACKGGGCNKGYDPPLRCRDSCLLKCPHCVSSFGDDVLLTICAVCSEYVSAIVGLP